MRLPALALAVFSIVITPDALAQTQPFTSFRRLVTANGWAPMVLDLEARKVTVFRENMYRYPAPGVETRNLAYDLYLGVRAAGRGRWLDGVRLEEAGYETGTNLIRTVQRTDGLRIVTTYVAPFSLPARAFVVVAEVTAERDVEDVALFSLHNLHLGSGPDRTQGERIDWSGRALIERGATGGASVIMPLGSAPRRTATPQNPFGMVTGGQRFADQLPAGPTDDVVSGFDFDVGRLASGETRRFAFAVGWAPDGDAMALETVIAAWHAGRAPLSILDDERAAWAAWMREGLRPGGAVSAQEMQVVMQSLAILRMGQVNEPGSPNGQMIASLPPGNWDIAWVRDGMIAVRALIETGHLPEAERALDFYIRGPFGDYRSYIGRDYGLSVCRYYGNGREESDSNHRGPNIELDGFGMYLETAAAYARSGAAGRAWAVANAARLGSGIADVLVDFRDPSTGLVAAESSIWESHWDDGGRQRWVFTSGTAVIGLKAWADVLDANMLPGGARYRERALEIAAAMELHLVDRVSGALGASVEQLGRADRAFADAQAALILGPSTIPASSAIGLATLDLLRDRLFLASTTRRGYKRNDDGDLYDEREWAVIDLGIASALRDAGRVAEADALVAWITGQATMNFGIVPELFDQTDARYAGEAPMIGFGAGAYLRALVHRGGTEAFDPVAPLDGGVVAPADGGVPPVGPDAAADASAEAPDAGGAVDASVAADGGASSRADASAVVEPLAEEGCGCRTSSARGSGAVLLGLLALGAVRRRTP